MGALWHEANLDGIRAAADGLLRRRSPFPAPDLPVTDPDNLCRLALPGLLGPGPQNHFTNVHRPLPAGSTVTGHAHPHHDPCPTPPEKRTFHLLTGAAVSRFNKCILSRNYFIDMRRELS